MNRPITMLAALFAMTAVIAGAFGAHGLKAHLGAEALEWWKTGAYYQLVHAIALFGLGYSPGLSNTARRRVAVAMVTGILVFAGTLYAMALGGPRWLGAITPIGGASLILAWAMIVVFVWRAPTPDAP